MINAKLKQNGYSHTPLIFLAKTIIIGNAYHVEIIVQFKVSMKEERIKRVQNFNECLEIIQEIETEFEAQRKEQESSSLILFRGQEDYNWDLQPGLGRNTLGIKKEELPIIESMLLEEFRRRAITFLPVYFNIDSILEWYALAQHCGLPTRLLDWSENPLIALYFAFSKEYYNAKFRALWILKSSVELLPLSDNLLQSNHIKIFKPNQSVKRIINQSGWFSVHNMYKTIQGIVIEDECGNKHTDQIEQGEFIPLNRDQIFIDCLYKIEIPNTLELRKEILCRLDRLGINQYSIFPDLDGLTSYLKWKYITNRS